VEERTTVSVSIGCRFVTFSCFHDGDVGSCIASCNPSPRPQQQFGPASQACAIDRAVRIADDVGILLPDCYRHTDADQGYNQPQGTGPLL
jgi:hypothetical protein